MVRMNFLSEIQRGVRVGDVRGSFALYLQFHVTNNLTLSDINALIDSKRKFKAVVMSIVFLIDYFEGH